MGARYWAGAVTLAMTFAACGRVVTAVSSPATVTSIRVIGPADSLGVGTTFVMRLTALDASGDSTAPPHVAWSSRDTLVAAISTAGVVTAVGAGRATITAQVGSLSAATVVLVRILPAAAIGVQGPTDSLVVGGSYLMRLAAFDSNGRAISPPPVTWSSSNPSVATVDTLGLVTARAAGVDTVQAKARTLTSSAVVTVKPPPPPVPTYLSIFPDAEFGDTLQLAPGQTLQLSRYEYQGVYSSSGGPVVQPTGQTIWNSSRSDLATVSSNGLVTALATGVTTIGVAVDQLMASRPIKVAATPGSVTVRFVDAVDELSGITLLASSGSPVPLTFGGVQTTTAPAGTLQVTAAGITPNVSYFEDDYVGVQQFLGFLPAQTHATIVAVGNGNFWGEVNFAPLYDWTAPVSADSAEVRVVLATLGGYNVYFTPPGAPAGVPFLQGCYLDWPFGYTSYAALAPGAFDIVLQYGKGFTGPEVARFTVTPQPGHATTYILAGKSASVLSVLTLVDH
jgi:uncharacterized protein YjdB